jgi:hypothetical protein
MQWQLFVFILFYINKTTIITRPEVNKPTDNLGTKTGSIVSYICVVHRIFVEKSAGEMQPGRLTLLL